MLSLSKYEAIARRQTVQSSPFDGLRVRTANAEPVETSWHSPRLQPYEYARSIRNGARSISGVWPMICWAIILPVTAPVVRPIWLWPKA